MHTQPDPRLHRTFLAATLIAIALAGCGAVGASPSPSPTATPGPLAVGTVTLTETGCQWSGNPGSGQTRPLGYVVDIRNETDDLAAFHTHRLNADTTWAEGTQMVERIQDAIAAGVEWPEDAFDASTIIADTTLQPGVDGTFVWVASPGTVGITCSANVEATDEVLSLFIVGPFEVSATSGG